jgi:uncharacterized membrane protein YhaH (DUF805 family)
MFSMFTWYFLSLHGRVSRQEFRLGYLGLVILNGLLVRILYRVTIPPVYYYHGRSEVDHMYRWPVLLVLLIIIWPLTAVFVKRLHDLNVSGWWMLAVLAIPPVSKAIDINAWNIFLLVVVLLSFIPGAAGSNRFGSDPLAHTRI